MSGTTEIMTGRIVVALERIAGVAHKPAKQRRNNPGKTAHELELERIAVALETIAAKAPEVEADEPEGDEDHDQDDDGDTEPT